MEWLSPRANSKENVEAGELAAGDIGEVLPQRFLDTAQLLVGEPQSSGDARRRRAAMPRDHHGATRADHSVQFADAGVQVGPDRHVVDRDDAIDAVVGQTGLLGSAEVKADPPGSHAGPVVSAGLIAHFRRRIDAEDPLGLRAFGEKTDETAGAVTDLEDMVSGLA